MPKHLRTGPNPAKWDSEVLMAAAPHQECLSWLLTQQPPCPCDSKFIAGIAGKGDLNVMKWLAQNMQIPSACWDERFAIAAVVSGSRPLLLWLWAVFPALHESPALCSMAVNKGDLSLLQWLRSLDPPCPWDHNCSFGAAGHKDLSLLQWVRGVDPPCPWTAACSSHAAGRGDLAMLKWMQAQSPPCVLDELSTIAAASSGHLPVLQWLVDKGCRVDGDLWYHAALAHPPCKSILQWL